MHAIGKAVAETNDSIVFPHIAAHDAPYCFREETIARRSQMNTVATASIRLVADDGIGVKTDRPARIARVPEIRQQRLFLFGKTADRICVVRKMRVEIGACGMIRMPLGDILGNDRLRRYEDDRPHAALTTPAGDGAHMLGIKLHRRELGT